VGYFPILVVFGVLLTGMVIIRPQGLITTRAPTGGAPKRFGGQRRAATPV
jgi:hypothetical protein